jgi:hypothetical protein
MNEIQKPLHQALMNILDYIGEDEAKDYFDTPPPERHNHIFESVLIAQRWMRNPGGDADYFGGCPQCGDGQNDGYLNVGRNQWFVCHLHRLRWHVGENLFSSWKSETERDWRENWELISRYEEVSRS